MSPSGRRVPTLTLTAGAVCPSPPRAGEGWETSHGGECGPRGCHRARPRQGDLLAQAPLRCGLDPPCARRLTLGRRDAGRPAKFNAACGASNTGLRLGLSRPASGRAERLLRVERGLPHQCLICLFCVKSRREPPPDDGDRFVSLRPDVRSPPDLQQTLQRFYGFHPQTELSGFVIMRFGETPEHMKIIKLIEYVASSTKVHLLRADHAKLDRLNLSNIETYMHGCSFGLAFLEDAEATGYNFNVAFEVGYMRALRKPMLLMKSTSLTRMPSDLFGDLYEGYDPRSGVGEIATQIIRWIAIHFPRNPDDSERTTYDAVSRLLTFLYPGRPLEDRPDHLSRHIDGLERFGYLTVGSVRRLLEETLKLSSSSRKLPILAKPDV